MRYEVGSLVRARGREWVVLPGSNDSLLQIKPLGGTDFERTALLTGIEPAEPASFALPDPARLGDAISVRILRDAVRLGFRASSGPFRSLGSIAVEPRPYQLVPLLMAMRLSPIRLLIADDVGIGKTIEAGLIAREMLARGEVERVCVLCPPHLAEQWQAELEEKFNLEPALVLPSTVARLERQCPPGASVFEQFPVTIVSLDYIKQQTRRDDFLRACPPLIIVDEAHTCTHGGQSANLRFELLRRLSADPKRHMILVTATPHSGNDAAFRSMLSLLRTEFEDLPGDLGGERDRPYRERLAAHFVQRRRTDIQKYLNEDTPFPERKERNDTYRLHPDYRRFLQRALDYAKEVVADKSGTQFQQRIRWWSALALLRSISSSPAAAADTLRARANGADGDDARQIDELARRSIMDQTEADTIEGFDVTGAADSDEPGAGTSPRRRRLLEMAQEADALRGAKDRKASGLVEVVRGLLKEGQGLSPIVFCKYISTAEYLAELLGSKLTGVDVACVTGLLPHDERENRVMELAAKPKRVLVCTDCLSEGINLQDHFDAVVHADLAWSPTRHEQREGRVDRFNQKSKEVRVVTYYGEDNPVDGVVLNILLRKHQAIRTRLGVSVPVPMGSEKVLEAIFESLVMRGISSTEQLDFADLLGFNESRQLDEEWQRAADREKVSRKLFAQHSIEVDEVAVELAEVRSALGSPLDLRRFVRDALQRMGVVTQDQGAFVLDLAPTPKALRDAVHYQKPFRATFDSPPPRDVVQLTRTHPFVEGLASYAMETALDGADNAVAARCGVTATGAVEQLTTLLVLRCRFMITGARSEMLAEEAVTVAFRGMPARPEWLPTEEAEPLLAAPPSGNIAPDHARGFLNRILLDIDALGPHLQEIADERAARALEAHRRVRRALPGAEAARQIRVQGAPDILGLYVLLPSGGSQR